jgi:hypothetical protein
VIASKLSLQINLSIENRAFSFKLFLKIFKILTLPTVQGKKKYFLFLLNFIAKLI